MRVRVRVRVRSQAEVARHLEARAHPLAVGRDEVRVERARRHARVALLREDLEVVDLVRVRVRVRVRRSRSRRPG